MYGVYHSIVFSSVVFSVLLYLVQHIIMVSQVLAFQTSGASFYTTFVKTCGNV